MEISNSTNPSNSPDSNNNLQLILIITFSSIFVILYFIYLTIIIFYIIKNYHKKKLCVFWIDYCCLILSGILFICIYLIYLIIFSINNKQRIINPKELSHNIFSILIIASLCIMCFTIIDTLLFDSITAILLSIKMNKIKSIKAKNLIQVSQKCKNINIIDILKMKTHYIYYIVFSVINTCFIILAILGFMDTDISRFNGILNLKGYFSYLLRYYHLAVLVLLIISIICMNISKGSLLKKEYFNNNRTAKKVYEIHFSQIVYFTDVISFKLIADLIMNIPALFFLALAQFNTISLIFSEFTIFVYIFIGGSEYFVIDDDSKAGVINNYIKFWFCFKKLNFHFGEKDHKVILDDFNFQYSAEEENVLESLNLAVIKNIEYKLIDDGNIFEREEENEYIELQTNRKLSKTNTNSLIKKKYLDFKSVSEFYLVQKLLMIFFQKNDKMYDNALKNMDENGIQIKKIGKERTTNRKSRLSMRSQESSFESNVNRISRMSIQESRKLITKIKAEQNDLFTSFEEKELFEELRLKFDIKNENYTFKLESLLTSDFFELYPFFQMSIRTILRSINPARNLKIFSKFIQRKTEDQKNYSIKNLKSVSRISIVNKITKCNIFNDDYDDYLKNSKELEKDLYYTYDLFLMYEMYDKKDFIDQDELKDIIIPYKKYLLSVVKNMDYSFLPLIIGIFELEIYDSTKIIILYRNPLYFTNFNKFNHWINFYLTEEPEKIKVSSMYNDIININEIEIKNSLQLNALDYDEIKKNLEHDYKFLSEINYIYPIIHLFIGDETGINKEDYKNRKKRKNENVYNLYNENSILGEVSLSGEESFGMLDMIGDMSINDFYNEDANNINEITSLFDKEYFTMSGNDMRTIKIYFTNLFRKDCKLINEINPEAKDYCNYLQEQLNNYLLNSTLFEDEKENENEEENKIK